MPVDKAQRAAHLRLRPGDARRGARQRRRRTRALVVLRHGAGALPQGLAARRPAAAAAAAPGGTRRSGWCRCWRRTTSTRVVTSSSLRCVQTVAPYADVTGWPLQQTDGSARRTPRPPASVEIVDELLAAQGVRGAVHPPAGAARRCFDALGVEARRAGARASCSSSTTARAGSSPSSGTDSGDSGRPITPVPVTVVSSSASRGTTGHPCSPCVHRRPRIRSPALPTFAVSVNVIRHDNQENEVKSTSIRRGLVPGIAALALALTACGGQDSGSDDDRRRTAARSSVDGSSTVYPLSNAAAELLNEENPDIKVTVGEAGTGGGFEVFCAGQTDISDASRPIEEDEVAACEARRRRVHRAPGRDRRAHRRRHPDLAVDCLTTDQLIDALGALGSQGHQLEPARPELPRRGDRALRPRHRLRHLRLHGHRRDRRRAEGARARLRVLGGRQRARPGCRRHRRVRWATSATPTTRRTPTTSRRSRSTTAAGASHRRPRPHRTAVHAAVPAAVHLREQRFVHRQEAVAELRRLLHREPAPTITEAAGFIPLNDDQYAETQVGPRGHRRLIEEPTIR